MSKLKTLKQITSPCSSTDRGKPEGYSGENFYGVATGEAIRILMKQEAVKWMKYMAKKAHKVDKESQIGMGWTIGWIVHFFNLTADDLKNIKYKKVYSGSKELGKL